MSLALSTFYRHGAAAIAVAIFGVGCGRHEDSGAWWRGEQERLELSHQLALKEYRHSQFGADHFADLQALKESNKELAASRLQLTTRKLALSQEIAGLQQDFSSFCVSTLRDYRGKVVGQKFPELGLISGKTYRDVKIAAIDDAGVTIRHADGSARLGYEDLDSDQRMRFGLEEGLALAAVEKEAQQASQYEKWIDQRMLLVQERESRIAEENKNAELAASRVRSLLASSSSVSSNPWNLSKSATAFSSRSTSYNSVYRSAYSPYRSRYRYVYYVPSCYRPYRPNNCVTSCHRVTPRHVTRTDGSHRTSFANTNLSYNP